MTAILYFWSEWFSLFLIYKSPWCFLPSLVSIGLSIQEKKPKIDFKDSSHEGHLRLQIGRILAIFLYKSPWCFLSSSGSAEKEKNRFSRWLPWWPSWISDWKDFTYIWSTRVHLMLPTNFQVFVCVEVLRPSQPNGVMSSAVSLHNHTFTGQA